MAFYLFRQTKNETKHNLDGTEQALGYCKTNV